MRERFNTFTSESFSYIIPVNKQEYKPNLLNLNYFWIAGFINTDGYFFFGLTKGVIPVISMGQHTKSLILLNAIKSFLGYGSTPNSKRKVREIRISKLSSIINLIGKLKQTSLIWS